MNTIKEDHKRIIEKKPLIHNITNYVVMNNTANVLLALGASPVMAHAHEEVEDMASIASALVINIGTLSSDWIEAMILAGKKANENNIPVVFDPVGVGATRFRNDMSAKILSEVKVNVIRGNGSEIMALAGASAATKGVDSLAQSEDSISSAKALAAKYSCVVVVSGETDYVTDGDKTEEIKGGHYLMGLVTGTGCMATSIIAAFCAVNQNYFSASVNAMSLIAFAGQKAGESTHGPGVFQSFFMDEIYEAGRE